MSCRRFVAYVGIVGALHGCVAMASGDQQVPSIRKDVGEYEIFLREYYALYNPKGSSKLADFYDTGATLIDPSFGLELKGRDQIGRLLVSALAKYDSLEFDILDAVASGDQLVVRGLMRATMKGRPLRVHYFSMFRFANRRIVEQHDLYDVHHLLEQLGTSTAKVP